MERKELKEVFKRIRKDNQGRQSIDYRGKHLNIEHRGNGLYKFTLYLNDFNTPSHISNTYQQHYYSVVAYNVEQAIDIIESEYNKMIAELEAAKKYNNERYGITE